MSDEVTLEQLFARGTAFFRDDLDDLGDDAQSEEIATQWFLAKMHFFPGAAELSRNFFHQIPVKWRNLKVCMAYVNSVPQHLGDIDHAAERYPSVVATALRKDHTILSLVHQTHQTGYLIRILIGTHPEAFFNGLSYCEWAREKMHPRLVEDACRRHPQVVLKLDPGLLTDVALSNLAIYGINQFHRVREARRFDLLTKPLSQGHWPRRNLVTAGLEKPNGVSSAARMLLESRSEDERALYMAYLMTHPIEKVAKVLGGKRGSKYLLEMYTEEQLLSNIKDMPLMVRGKVLESNLGL